MAGNKRYLEFQQFPKYEIMYKRAFDRMLKRHKSRQRDNTIRETVDWETADDVWSWWMEDKNLDGQMEIDNV